MHLFHYNKSDLAFQQLGLNQTAASEELVEEGRIISHDPV